MSAAKPVLALALALAAATAVTAVTSLAAEGPAAPATPPAKRLLFTGDVLLSRQARREIELTKTSPWARLAPVLGGADLLAGNLEGAVGDESACVPARDASPCFAIPRDLVPLLPGAGFTAMTHENNHAGDLGASGRAATLAALDDAGVAPVTFDGSPRFLRVGEETVALIAISLVPGRDGAAQAVPSTALAQKLRLASRLAGLVVVSVHWGEQLLTWPSDAQREAARWLVAHGASLVVGHHPHVVQAAECVDGRPVFFSLGNHVFDQKYPETKRGLVAECRLAGGRLTCGGLATETARGSSFPEPRGEDAATRAALAGCPVPLDAPFRAGDVTLRPLPGTTADRLVLEARRDGRPVWRTRATHLLSIEPGPGWLLALEQHPSSIDRETGPRPYVYAVGPHGLVARWRGSALAWPLLDATLLPDGRLCALHRGDSFVTLDPASTATRHAVYSWNGFGFSGVEDAAALEACAALLVSGRPASGGARGIAPPAP